MASAGVVRSTALRAGGACVRCRKGKTKCVYENGRAPCKNCAKGMHECYLPSEGLAAGSSPARHAAVHRPARESLPAVGAADPRAVNPAAPGGPRHVQANALEKLTPELVAECERIVSKTYPACVAFHKPTFIAQLKNSTIEGSLLYALLCTAARSSPTLIRRYGGQGGGLGAAAMAADHFAVKAMSIINSNLDTPSLADIQAICLVIIHEWGSRQAVRAYIYLGQAGRMVQMYRVMHSHHNDAGDNFLQEESFRRALWLLYILDCLLTSHPGRQPALAASDITEVSLPCSDMNFAFGNAVTVETLGRTSPARRSPGAPADVVGEFGQIIRATRIWREVVHMLMTNGVESFSDAACADLMTSIEDLRRELPMQFIDKPGQINLHITMGSGFTYAMLHCLLHCAAIFVHRRRLLQHVTAPGFNVETWRHTPQCHELMDRLLTSCHTTIAMLTALEAGFDKESIPCFPVVMLFCSFTASATVAYLSLKTLTPPNAVETAAHIVRDGLRFMQEGVDTWPLIASWLRHLMVMQRVLEVEEIGGHAVSDHARASSVKEEGFNGDSNSAEAMDYEQGRGHSRGSQPPVKAPGSAAGDSGRESEPPAPSRRTGVTTINGGGSNSVGTPNTMMTSPQPGQSEPHRSPDSVAAPLPPNGSGDHGPDRVPSAAPPGSQDMTAAELCSAFETQLLELDDLAAFMGGGV